MSVDSRLSISQSFVIGLALFSMFFGSGNLVFPLVVGTAAGAQSSWAVTGFLLTGVLLPFLGIFAMLRFDGNVKRFFNFLLGNRLGFWVCFALLAVWIPLGSAPRCITVSYAAVKQLLPFIPLWLFSLGACIAIYPFCVSRSRMLDLLGYVLTPLLLSCLGLILVLGLIKLPPLVSTTQQPEMQVLWMGLKEGYNTMDLIASLFFSAVIVAKFKSSGQASQAQRLAWRSGMIGASLLAVVYLGFILVAAGHAASLEGVAREELLLRLAQHFLGTSWSILPIFAIALSCITTAIALVFIFSEFLAKEVAPGRLSMQKAVLLTLLLTFILSTLGFAGIARLVGPLLELAYPFLIGLMCCNACLLTYTDYQRRHVAE